MNFAIGIRNSTFRILAHAGRTHMVPSATGIGWQLGITFIPQTFFHLHAANTGNSSLFTDQLNYFTQASFSNGVRSQFNIARGIPNESISVSSVTRDKGFGDCSSLTTTSYESCALDSK